MEEVGQIIDHAAKQGDRWLFIATLTVLLIFLGVIWRWMVNDRDKVAKRLTEITDRHITQSEKLAEVVANNTNALKEVSSVVVMCRRGVQERHDHRS